MTTTDVVFIQGGGEGAYDEDAQLADSLRRALGPEYEVHYPRMPDEAEPDMEPWKRKISSELSRMHGEVVLVGHSLGGSVVLNYLAEEKIEQPIAGLFVLAAPSWDGDRWNFDDLKLPDDMADRLSPIPRIFLYHCRDDDVVPFAHLALHGARIPQAVIRPVDRGGHQFGNDLIDIVRDIRADKG